MANDMDNISPVSRKEDFLTTLVYYYISTLIVILGVEFGHHYVSLCTLHPSHSTRTDVLSSYANWDGEWYKRIATEGYSYDPDRMSSVAFFPLYPTIASPMVKLFGLRSEWALLIVSHTALFCSYFLFLRYLRVRTDQPMSEEHVQGSFTALVFFPMTFFFRMTYSESLFLLLILSTLMAIRLKKPLIIIALLIGLATATRSVGVLLGPVFVVHLWNESRSRREFFLRCLSFGPICLLGPIAYMVFLDLEYSDPFAFVQAQENWLVRHDLTTWGDRLWCLVTLQPILDNFNPDSVAYFGLPHNGILDWLNIRILNVGYFLFAVAVIGLGSLKKWLTRDEIILSSLLLMIPLLTNGIPHAMTSHARYMAIVFPFYIVLGRLLSDLGRQFATISVAIMTLLLFIYSSLFASWYFFF